MNIIGWIIIAIIVYIFFRSISGSGQKSKQPKSKSKIREDGYTVRRTGRGATREVDITRSSLTQNAERQESMGNYEEASRLFIRAGQVYSAAKMKAMIGPQGAESTIDLIRANAPNQFETITKNLVNEFFYRLNQPATASALLRAAGFFDEAIAVEAAAGIQKAEAPTVVSSGQPSVSNSINVNQPSVSETKPEPAIQSPSKVTTLDTKPIPPIETVEQPKPAISRPTDIPNTLMIASTDLPDNCSVCKRPIKAGDSFIYCLNCGKPGHYRDLGELMKVKGICPNCKERLVMSMYKIE